MFPFQRISACSLSLLSFMSSLFVCTYYLRITSRPTIVLTLSTPLHYNELFESLLFFFSFCRRQRATGVTFLPSPFLPLKRSPPALAFAVPLSYFSLFLGGFSTFSISVFFFFSICYLNTMRHPHPSFANSSPAHTTPPLFIKIRRNARKATESGMNKTPSFNNTPFSEENMTSFCPRSFPVTPYYSVKERVNR
jgi:hypothetical protein